MYRYLRLIYFFITQSALAAFVINGAPPYIEQNILQRLEYKVRTSMNDLNEQSIDQIQRETVEAIKPYGYFNPTVTVNQQNMDIHINISLNQIAYIKKINIDYSRNDIDEKLMEAVRQSVSSFEYAPFNMDSLSDITNNIKKAALDAGYYDVLVTRGETSINRYTNFAYITILVNPKQKNQYGDIILPEKANPQCFNRYHNITPGETFSDDKVRAFQTNMLKSGLFSFSEVKAQPRDLEPHIQDIIVNYEDIASNHYFFGLGLRANLGEKTLTPDLQTRFTFNNLGSCGIKQTNTIHISPGETANIHGQSQLIIPSEYSIDDFSLISLSYSDSNVKAEDFSKSLQLYALTQKSHKTWEHQFSLNLLMEESTLNQLDPYITTLIFPQYQVQTRSKQGTNTLKLKAKARGGLQALGSDINFFQLTASAKLKTDLQPFTIRNRTTFGKVWTEEFAQYPLSMQYFLGGGNSHRGLDYHEINEGKNFFLSRNSFQVKFPQNILIGGFYDSGYCTHSDDFSLNPAAGILLSYSTNFGGFDLSIGRLTNGSKWVILFHAEPGDELQ